jgi:hypothetical protein
VIDIEKRQLLVTDLGQRLERLFGDFLAGLGVNLAGLRIDEILGDVLADQVLVREA